MGNTGFKGIDVRNTGNELVIRAFLQDAAGAILATGTTTYYIDELQSDGTIKCYEFNDNTFKTAATTLTTPTAAMTHRTRNNGTNTGRWTAVLSTLTGFTVGAIYQIHVSNTGASPPDQEREFQYGSAEGDLTTTSTGTGTGALLSDVTRWLTAAPNALQAGRVDSYPGATPATMSFNNTGQTTNLPADLKAILSSLLTEVNVHALAAGLMKFFDVATPTKTINDIATDSSGIGTLLGLFTSARAGYLDNLSAGAVATAAALANVANNTFVGTNIPQILERPDSSSDTLQITVIFNDETGSPKDIDASANPTLTLVNDAGTDRSGRMGGWSHPSTGKYTAAYTNTSTDTLERLHWDISQTVNSKLRRWVGSTQLVDTTKVDFTSGDRTQLVAIYNVIPAFTPLIDSNGRATLTPAEHTSITIDVQGGLTAQGYTATRSAKLDNLNATIGSRAVPGDRMDLIDVLNVTSVAQIQSGLATGANLATVASNVAAEKVVTDRIATGLQIIGSGPNYQFSTPMLANAPSGGGGGGGGTTNVYEMTESSFSDQS